MIRFSIIIFVLTLPFIAKAQDSLKLKTDTLAGEKTKIAQAVDDRFEFGNSYKSKLFQPTVHHGTYILPFRWTDRFNRQPQSLNPERPRPEHKEYQNVEAKFQVSLKAKIAQGLIAGKGNLWLGFTQSSYWQVYNGKLSRPFRETNYEPEVFITYPLNLSIGNFKIKMAGVSLNHQSNGKEDALSRSWNRVIFSTGYQWGNWAMMHRFWHRMKEEVKEDDNPYITQYIGKSDLQLVYNSNKHIFNLFLRSNLHKRHRGYAELSYIYPIKDNLKILFQASHGYGDALVEYNHKQTNLGIGFMLLDF